MQLHGPLILKQIVAQNSNDLLHFLSHIYFLL
jgi:hypothetical protein